MNEGSRQFTWGVLEDRGGAPQYQTVRARAVSDSDAAEDEFIVAVGDRRHRTSYRPLSDYEGMHRIFTDTPDNPGGVLAFASRFGLLGEPEQLQSKTGDELERAGERVSLWLKEIRQMQTAVELWELIQGNDTEASEALDKWMFPHTQEGEPRENPPKSWPIDPRPHIGLMGHLGGGLSFSAVGFGLQNLAAIIDKNLAKRLRAGMLPDYERRTLTFDVIPENLIGALWLEFAMAVSGNKQYQRCEKCGTHFMVKTSRRKYCSNACKQAVYDQQKRARVAAANGGDHGENS